MYLSPQTNHHHDLIPQIIVFYPPAIGRKKEKNTEYLKNLSQRFHQDLLDKILVIFLFSRRFR